MSKIIAQDKREQKQKDQGQKGRQITGKGLKEPILTALVKAPDGTEIIYTPNPRWYQSLPQLVKTDRRSQRKHCS